ncbi:MAG: hypothetical protein ACXVW9_17885 [Nocardioidaceae bacterium]
MDPDPLLAVADELYALPPAQFTAARKEAAAAARTDGDRELAGRIGALRKPSVAAWVVNQLVRREAAQMDQLLTLGESLRQAQAELDASALRELSRQRRQVTAAVTAHGRGLAEGLGVKVGDQVARQVEETLHAAMIDPDAAAAVRTGLLSEPLSATGVGSFDVGLVVADAAALGREPGPEAAPADGAPALSVVPDNTQALAEAEEVLAEATAEADAAREKAGKAGRRVAKAEARVLQLQAELEEVRRRAAELEHQLDLTSDDLDDLQARQKKAERRRMDAEADEAEAREHLERLKNR